VSTCTHLHRHSRSLNGDSKRTIVLIAGIIVFGILLGIGGAYANRRHIRMHPELYPGLRAAIPPTADPESDAQGDDGDTPALVELRAEASALRAEAARLREARLRAEVLELREEVARLRALPASAAPDEKAG
jgi:hypothetical protein